jgi:uncharacterized protein YqcC (DUF446 family)
MEELETELRRLDLWEEESPPDMALASKQPFCFDTLSFTQWLQWVFIPRTRSVLRLHTSLPSYSSIRPLAEEALRDHEGGGRLIGLIDRFDRLINSTCKAEARH